MENEIEFCIMRIKDIIKSFHQDLIEEGILKINSFISLQDYDEFLNTWVENYCLEESRVRSEEYD